MRLFLSLILFFLFSSLLAQSNLPATKDDIRLLKDDIRLLKDDIKLLKTDILREIDKRFEQTDKRFEDMNRRFEDMNKRFEDMNKRFDNMINIIIFAFSVMTGALGLLYYQRSKPMNVNDLVTLFRTADRDTKRILKQEIQRILE